MVTIDGYPIDVVVREEHGFENDVTEDPVETGADTTDHIRGKNPTVTLGDAWVSDTPLDDSLRDGITLPSREALDRLLAIDAAKEPVTLVTSIRTYTNMALVSLSIPRDDKTGDALGFTARFRQIRFAENRRVVVEVATPRGKAKVNRGNKPSKPITAPEDNRTATLRLFQSMGVFTED